MCVSSFLVSPYFVIFLKRKKFRTCLSPQCPKMSWMAAKLFAKFHHNNMEMKINESVRLTLPTSVKSTFSFFLKIKPRRKSKQFNHKIFGVKFRFVSDWFSHTCGEVVFRFFSPYTMWIPNWKKFRIQYSSLIWWVNIFASTFLNGPNIHNNISVII